jgi:chromosome partitioning protein
MMAKTISIVNQKGGVGKTTTSINLSACLAIRGKKVLLIDTDTQGNATSGLGFDKNDIEFTIYEVLVGQCQAKDAVLKTEMENLFMISSNVQLAGAGVELVDVEDRETILKRAIEPIKPDYDYIFIDCPPSLGLITLNCLIASESVLIPLQCEFYALEGMSELLDTIMLVQNGLNETLKLEGILMTMYDKRTNLSRQVVDEVQEYFKDKVYKTFIPRNVKLGEAPSFGKPVILYDPECTGSLAYMSLAEEVISHG